MRLLSGYQGPSRALARMLLAIGTALAVVTSCVSDADSEPTFVVGWVVLGIICVCMLILFVGVIRYIMAGRRPKESTPQQPAQLDYEYREEEEEDY